MECRMYEINFLISLGWAERELLHNTSLSLALGRPRLYLLPTLLRKIKRVSFIFNEIVGTAHF